VVDPDDVGTLGLVTEVRLVGGIAVGGDEGPSEEECRVVCGRDDGVHGSGSPANGGALQVLLEGLYTATDPANLLCFLLLAHGMSRLPRAGRSSRRNGGQILAHRAHHQRAARSCSLRMNRQQH
jgi:hypothetical protein